MKIKCICRQCQKEFKLFPSEIKRMGNFCSYKCYQTNRKTKRIFKKCPICGEIFRTMPSEIREGYGKYCSHKCCGMGQKKRLIKKCLICGKEFGAYPSEIKKGFNKFCSRECMGKWRSENLIKEKSPAWRGGLIIKKCLVCNKEFKIKKCGKEKSKFCSRKCCNIWQSKNIRGQNHPCWKGGKIERECLICSKKFKVIPAIIKIGGGKFCSLSCASIWKKLHQKNKNTSIELLVEKELTRRGIKFQKQYPIWQARTIPDFFIPPNICVYCDGNYWHSLPKAKLKDFNQNYWLEFLGYKVYRFWEKDIKKSVKKCIDKIFKEKRK